MLSVMNLGGDGLGAAGLRSAGRLETADAIVFVESCVLTGALNYHGWSQNATRCSLTWSVVGAPAWKKQVQDAQPPPTEDARIRDIGQNRVCCSDSHSDHWNSLVWSHILGIISVFFVVVPPLVSRLPEDWRYMMKFKPNQTRTYDGEGFKRRAACLCFRNDKEDEVRWLGSFCFGDPCQ